MIVCTECGSEHEDEAAFCSSCGAFLEWSGRKVEPGDALEDAAAPDHETAVAVAAAAPSAPVSIAPARPGPEYVPRPPVEIEGPPPQVGDLLCWRCGAGNAPHLHFCRRCGTTLGGAPVVEPTLWQRLLRRRRRAVPAGTRRGWAARRQRLPGTREELAKRAGVVAAVVAVLAMLVGAVVWAWKAHLDDRARGGYTSVRQTFFPRYEPVRAWAVASSSNRRRHRARAAFDGDLNTFWLAARRRGGNGARLVVTFKPATDLAKVGISAGDPTQAQSTPKALGVTLLRWSNERGRRGWRLVGARRLPLENRPGFQRRDLQVENVGRIVLTVRGVYPGSAPRASAALTEVEFFRKE